MKKRIRSFGMLIIASAVICTGLLAGNTVQAQENEGQILSWTDFTIKVGHVTQFREGVKTWKNCYIENEGENTWNMWRRIQGEGTVLRLTTIMENWAEWDEPPGEVGRACRHLVENLITPNVQNTVSGLSRIMTGIGRENTDTVTVVSSTTYRVNNFRLFNSTIREVDSIVREVEGDSRWWFFNIIGGGENAGHYSIARPYENFAAMDNPGEGVWTLIENAHGSEKREQLQSDFLSSFDTAWSYIYRRDAELSHSGSD